MPIYSDYFTQAGEMMRFIGALLISFQFICAPVTAADLGERSPSPVSFLMLDQLARIEAQHFETAVRTSLSSLESKGIVALLGKKWTPEETKVFGPIKNRSIKFKETAKGEWAASIEGYTLAFSLAELYQHQIRIDGKTFDFKDVKLADLEEKLRGLVGVSKTGFFEILFQNAVGIGKAYAIPPLAWLLIIGFTGALAVIRRAYSKMVLGPKEAAGKFNQLSAQLNSQAQTCEMANTNDQAYGTTFDLASNITSTSLFDALSSPTETLQAQLKKQLEERSVNKASCFTSLHQASEMLDMQVPDPNTAIFQNRVRFLSASESNGVEDNNTDALIRLCNSYHRLNLCLHHFVGAHVNNSDFSSFKDVARRSHLRYQRRSGARRE